MTLLAPVPPPVPETAAGSTAVNAWRGVLGRLREIYDRRTSPPETRSADGTIRVGIYTLVLFFGLLATWAAVTPLDGAVLGGGYLVVSGNRKVVQHREGGVIARVMVEENDKVAEGQPLLELDGTQIAANIDAMDSQIFSDMILIARATAEINGQDRFDFPPDVPDAPQIREVFERESSIFRNHRAYLGSEVELRELKAQQLKVLLDSQRKQLAATERQAALVERQLGTSMEMQKKGLETNFRVLDLSRAAQGLRADVAAQSAQMSDTITKIAGVESEKSTVLSTMLEQVAKDLRDAQLRINETRPKVEALRDASRRLVVRAPVSGNVVNVTVFNNDGVVEPGQKILEIVPENDEIVAEIRVRPEDIDHIFVDQKAEIIIQGLSAQKNPPIQSRIKSKSADHFVEQHSGATYFKVEVELLDDQQKGALMGRLQPGMSAQAAFPTVSRTVLDYFVSPLKDKLRGSMREQ